MGLESTIFKIYVKCIYTPNFTQQMPAKILNGYVRFSGGEGDMGNLSNLSVTVISSISPATVSSPDGLI